MVQDMVSGTTCLLQGADAGGADGCAKGFQLRLLGLVRGSLPHTVGSDAALHKAMHTARPAGGGHSARARSAA